MFKTILYANKDMEGGKLLLSSMGLMKLSFELDGISSNYYMIRRAEAEYYHMYIQQNHYFREQVLFFYI